MCHYQEGESNKVAVVLSCPGRYEKEENRPAAKVTGENLSILINILNEKGFEPFSGLDRSKIRITNAWAQVEYKEETNRSEARIDEVLEENNLERLSKEIEDITEIILCCGDRANNALQALENSNKLKKNVKIIEIRHLGMRGLNKISKDIYGDKIIPVRHYKNAKLKKIKGKENTISRLNTVAQNIIDQYNSSN